MKITNILSAALLVSLILTLIFQYLSSPTYVLSATNHIVISEVQIAGPGSVNEDFVELHNPTDSDYDLNGHRLVKRTASGASDSAIKSWTSQTIIPAHGYYLWANSSWTPSVAADSSTSATLAANNGVALRQGLANTGVIVDSVAWGTATNEFVETNPYPTNPEAGTSIERKPGETNPLGGNGDDTNNNSVDFVLRTTSEPQNTSSATEPVEISLTPTNTPTTSPTPTENPTPTTTPTPTIEPSPTPTFLPIPTQAETLGVFDFGRYKTICYLEYKAMNVGPLNFLFPKLNCVRVAN